MGGKNVLWLRSIPSTKPDIRRSQPPIQKKNHSSRATFHTGWALNDRPPFSGRPSLTGHCGHGWTCSLPRLVENDPSRPFDDQFAVLHNAVSASWTIWYVWAPDLHEAAHFHLIGRRRDGSTCHLSLMRHRRKEAP